MPRTFDTPIHTTDQSLDRVLAAGLPVLFVFLDGQAPVALQQMMERLAREYAGAMLLVQIQMKENPVAKQRYQVSRAPAIVAVRKGQVFSKAEGISADDLTRHTAYLLGKGPKPEAERTAEPRQGANRPSGRTAGTAEGNPLVVTDATFDQEVIRSTRPVLVDFWAPWCGPCRMTEPIVEKLAHEMAGRMTVAKVNVDENPMIAQRYDIRSIPTMMVFRNGQLIDRWAGALPEPAMRSRIAPFTGR